MTVEIAILFNQKKNYQQFGSLAISPLPERGVGVNAEEKEGVLL
jgi:hypothetical protein